MQYYIDQINLALQTYSYSTNLKMARFFVMRQNEISELIPEGNHSKKRHSDYEILLKKALKILSNVKPIRSNSRTHKACISGVSGETNSV